MHFKTLIFSDLKEYNDFLENTITAANVANIVKIQILSLNTIVVTYLAA
jgi:hypothetical protein